MSILDCIDLHECYHVKLTQNNQKISAISVDLKWMIIKSIRSRQIVLFAKLS